MDLNSDLCSTLPDAQQKEWLVTNGIGGYAMGTVPGILTRSYHGLLIAALEPPLGQTLLVQKLDETASCRGGEYPLFSDLHVNGAYQPKGYRYLNRFRLEGSTPVWSFAFANVLLEKRIWMEQEANTTYIKYALVKASEPIHLSIDVIVNCRNHHFLTRPGEINFEISPVENGINIRATPDGASFKILGRNSSWTRRSRWLQGYYLAQEAYRGQGHVEANLLAAKCQFTLEFGQEIILIASTEEDALVGCSKAYARRRGRDLNLLERSPLLTFLKNEKAESDHHVDIRSLEQLHLAADQFIVRREASGIDNGRSIIAGYPWFTDWGRDTMIALQGLTLATGRTDEAAKILKTFAGFASQGMLPNRFPEVGKEPEYNTSDASLWYFVAISAYFTETADEGLLAELYSTLKDIIRWHLKGTRYKIKVDPADGLLFAGELDQQLTWMDAKVGNWVVTPRIGKPVEISALWFNALKIMQQFTKVLGGDGSDYRDLAAAAKAGFSRFWNADAGCCYDVIDGPNGHDDSLRPNQLLAVSLRHSPLNSQQQKAVVDICQRELLTPFGLRSLAPGHKKYCGEYGGNVEKRDAAYHQGTVWAWLIGPFVSAHFRCYNDIEAARRFLDPLLDHLSDHGIGSISEIFDGDRPFKPRGCPAQAWSVGELLRVYRQLLDPSAQDQPQTGSHQPSNS